MVRAAMRTKGFRRLVAFPRGKVDALVACHRPDGRIQAHVFMSHAAWMVKCRLHSDWKYYTMLLKTKLFKGVET